MRKTPGGKPSLREDQRLYLGLSPCRKPPRTLSIFSHHHCTMNSESCQAHIWRGPSCVTDRAMLLIVGLPDPVRLWILRLWCRFRLWACHVITSFLTNSCYSLPMGARCARRGRVGCAACAGPCSGAWPVTSCAWHGGRLYASWRVARDQAFGIGAP